MAILAPSRRSVRPITQQFTLPPPLGGMNARDLLTGIKDGDALWIENLICRTDGLVLREGKEEWRSLSGPALSLMSWTGKNRTPRLFAATQSTITDVTLPGAYTAPSVSGLGGGIWASAMMTNAGGSWLGCVNGANGVRLYNGTEWSTATITDASAADFIDICTHQHRWFFAAKDSLDLYYLGVDHIQGEAKKLRLAPRCSKGGVVVAIASMSSDGGRNSNDQLVAVTSEGEMIVYGGVSPHKADSWSLVGVFNVPKPVGRRCFVQMGGSLGYMSVLGLLPVPGVLGAADKDKQNAAVTDKIFNAFRLSTRAAPANSHAWAAVESTTQGLLILNVPHHGGSTQYVQDGATKGWSVFSAFDSTCWASHGDDLFFGDSTGVVWRYGGVKDGPDIVPMLDLGTGGHGVSSDTGTHLDLIQNPINGLVVHAYSRFKFAGRKGFKRTRPMFDLPTKAKPRFEMLCDYRPLVTSYENGACYVDSKRLWGGITWPQTPGEWETRDPAAVNEWRSVSGRAATSGALVMAIRAVGPLTYRGADIVFETGGGV